MNFDLEKIKARMERIQGAWNGDESGLAEDRASIAQEILDVIETLEENGKELQELLQGLEEL